jgi:phosphoribosyl 1,2-cyclic phosphodiesterase
MKRLCVLGSGSKGNCTFIESGNTRILIDAGLSAKQIETRLESIGVAPESIKGICITHDHVDHYQGARVFCERWGTHLYANRETRLGIVASHDSFRGLNWKEFQTNETFRIGIIGIHSFRISHDASDPVGFVLTLGNTRIGICTDLGIVTESVYEVLRPCEVIVLESNHDPRMLAASDRPEANKIRIAGKKGHLCNLASARFAVRLAKAGNLKRLYLAHLSEECNRETIARQTVSSEFRKNGISGVEICMTHQGKKAAVWKSEKSGTKIPAKKRKNQKSRKKPKAGSGNSFFKWFFCS